MKGRQVTKKKKKKLTFCKKEGECKAGQYHGGPEGTGDPGGQCWDRGSQGNFMMAQLPLPGLVSQ